MSEDLKVTSISELKKMSLGEIVELPSFSENNKFFARLKRPSLLNMLKSGKIPNTLLSTANNLFESGIQKAIDEDDNGTLNALFDVLTIICEESFVEPKYNDLIKEGIELTDEQIMFVFNYSQNGVKALDSFRS